MPQVIGVKFKNAGKLYYFSPENLKNEAGEYPSIALEDGVIVETANGTEFGWVAAGLTEVDESELSSALKPVVRMATPEDVKQVQRNSEKAKEVDV